MARVVRFAIKAYKPGLKKNKEIVKELREEVK